MSEQNLTVLENLISSYIKTIGEPNNWLRPFSETNGYSLLVPHVKDEKGKQQKSTLFKLVEKQCEDLKHTGVWIEIFYKGKEYRVFGTSEKKFCVIKLGQKTSEEEDAIESMRSFDQLVTQAFNIPKDNFEQSEVL